MVDWKLTFAQSGGDQSFSALLFVHVPTNGCLFEFLAPRPWNTWKQYAKIYSFYADTDPKSCFLIL